MDIKALATSHTTSSFDSTESVPRPRKSKFQRFWIDGHRQARFDWSQKWRGFGVCFAIFVWAGGLLVGIIMLNYLTQVKVDLITTITACQPDGEFNIVPGSYSYWSWSGLFQITLGFGTLTFTQAKAIDVIWHICIGRGGQALIAFISFNVFVKYVTTSMEVAPITLNTYRMIFLQNESLLLGIPRLIRDFTQRRGLHSRLAMVFMVLSMVFVLVFPTLANAMAGYSANVESYIKNRDNNLDTFNSFNIVVYTIHDGKRINKTDDYPVALWKYPWQQHALNSISAPMFSLSGFPLDCEHAALSWFSPEDCQNVRLMYNVSEYVGLHDFNGMKQTTSTFMGVSLEAPVLNISGTYIPIAPEWESRYTGVVNGLNGSAEFPTTVSYQTPQRLKWISSGQVYDWEDIKSRGTCQAVGNYQWGWSFVQLNIVLTLILLWTIGILTMWLSTKSTMRKRGRIEVAGRYKSVLELSDAMRSQLIRVEEKNLHNVTESTLRQRIHVELQGGIIAYETPLLPDKKDDIGTKDKLMAWAKREKIWLGIIVVLVVAGGTFPLFAPLPLLILPYLLLIAMAFSMHVGTTGQSRGVLLFWSFLLLNLLPQTLVATLFSNRKYNSSA